MLCLNPNYLSFRNEFFEKINPKLAEYCSRFETDLLRKLKKLPDYEKDQYYSYYCTAVGYLDDSMIESNFFFKGPLGMGFAFNHLSSGNYLIIVKNEKISLFLDLFEILIQRIVLHLNSQKNIEWIFNSEYNLVFCNGLKIDLFWMIDGHFIKPCESIGLFHVQTLNFLQSKINGEKMKIIRKCIVQNDYIDAKYDMI